MKKTGIILMILLLSWGGITRTEAQTLSREQTETIQLQVDSVFQNMVSIAEKLDIDRLSSGVDDTREAGFISNGKYYARYSVLIEDFKKNAQGLDHQVISVKEKKISVLSDKIVVLTAKGVAVAFISDGREISADFHWSFIYEKTDTDWKVIYSHQSIVK